MTLQNAPPGLDYERDRRLQRLVLLFKFFCMITFFGVSFPLFLFHQAENDLHLQSFKEMVAACLVKDPKKRPTSEKLLKHQFFKHARSKEFWSRLFLMASLH